jgi:hypothetical protein
MRGRCLSWVINGPDGPETPLPVRPRERTSSDRADWSVWCQNRTNSDKLIKAAALCR